MKNRSAVHILEYLQNTHLLGNQINLFMSDRLNLQIFKDYCMVSAKVCNITED